MIPPVPFYLLRHGESEANVTGLVAGAGVDSPLTALGRAQADDLGNYMKRLEAIPSRIFHSPQIRAKETAQRVNRHLDLEMTEIFDLREHDFAAWEGLPWEQVREKVHADEQAPGGESRSDLARRIKKVLDEILDTPHATPPLIVAHGGTFHAIAKLYQWQFGAIRNCHLHRFDPAAHPVFPWEVWQHDISGNQILRNRSAYCPFSFREVS